MNALISSLLGAASSALATLVAPVTRPGAGATGESQAGTEGFASALTAALAPQAVAAVAGTAVISPEGELDTLAGEAGTGDSEALTTALGIAGALGAGLMPGAVLADPAASTESAAGTPAENPAGTPTGSGSSGGTASADTRARGAATPTSAGPQTAGAAASPIAAEGGSNGEAAGSASEIADGPRAANPNRIQSGLAPLDGEFRSKLDRVISRMREEFGHKVEVVETVRSPERQDFLFAQGRTRPGPVVTWTRDSNHEEGRAADLLIDGSYENALAFRRLARVAQEEGLRTLGARDPGHVELPGSGTGSAPRAVLAEGLTTPGVQKPLVADPVVQAGVARVASVAQVAAVAQPRVAAVASVARVGGGSGSVSVSRPGLVAEPTRGSSPRVAAATPDALVASGTPGTEEVEVNTTELFDVAVQREPKVSEKAAPSAEAGTRVEVGPVEARASEPGAREPVTHVSTVEGASGRAAPASAPREVAGVFGADAAERIARVLQIQDGAASRPLSQVTLRVDSPDGGEDRIRIDLRGGSVGASISTSDVGAAEHMNSRIGELQRALEKQGLEAEYLQVRSTAAPRATEMVEAVRMATLADLVGSRGAADAGTQRDRDESRTRDGLFRERDEENQNPRQRSQREPKQGRDQ